MRVVTKKIELARVRYYSLTRNVTALSPVYQTKITTVDICLYCRKFCLTELLAIPFFGKSHFDENGNFVRQGNDVFFKI